jgi:hypothetical protein
MLLLFFSKVEKMRRITQTVVIAGMMASHLLFITFIIVAYGVNIVVQTTHEEMVKLSKHEWTEEMVHNMMSFVVSYFSKKTTEGVKNGATSVKNGWSPELLQSVMGWSPELLLLRMG